MLQACWSGSIHTPVAANVSVSLRPDEAQQKTDGCEHCLTLLFETTRLKLFENGGQVWLCNVHSLRLISAEGDGNSSRLAPSRRGLAGGSWLRTQQTDFQHQLADAV
jgi:hypothetical protein